MEKPNNTPTTPSGGCQPGQGTLPGTCAPMAFPFVPVQEENPVRYSRMEALQTGTLFPGLDLPFKAACTMRFRKVILKQQNRKR